MKHLGFKEIFTGRRNILTVTAVFIGGYFIAYPLVGLVQDKIGPYQTMAIGLVVLIVGDYILDTFRKKDK